MWRRFLLCWRFVRDLKYSESAAEKPWTDTKAKHFEAFMTSATGVHYGARMKNLAVEKAMAAVRNRESTPWAAGVAYGVQIAIAYSDSHLPAEAVPGQPEVIPDTDADTEAMIQRILAEASNA